MTGWWGWTEVADYTELVTAIQCGISIILSSVAIYFLWCLFKKVRRTEMRGLWSSFLTILVALLLWGIARGFTFFAEDLFIYFYSVLPILYVIIFIFSILMGRSIREMA